MKPFVKPDEIFSRFTPSTTFGKIVNFFITRIILAVIFIAPALILHNILYDYVFTSIMEESYFFYIRYLEITISILLIIYLYKLYTRVIEKRPALEYSCKKGFREFALGILIGAGMVAFSVGVLSLFGYYTIEEINSPQIILTRIFRYAMGSFLEEILFTLILFKILEEFAGSWIAIVVVCLFFGIAHYGNDNSTIWSSAAISLSDLAIIAPFILSRRFWMPWAVHWSWNLAQTGIFGLSNSGMDQGGWITPTVTGPEWLTGGVFGMEASYFSVSINFIVGLFILYLAIKNKQMVMPSWKRN